MKTRNIMEDMQVRKNFIESLYVTGENNDADAKPENAKGNAATLKLSEEGKQKLAELQNMKQWAQQMKTERENARDNGDELGKIMTIFRRIANGDIVPWKDEKKLMEYSAEMYQAAKNIASMRKNEEPKKYKSVEDEKKDKRGDKSEITNGIISKCNINLCQEDHAAGGLLQTAFGEKEC